MLERLAEGPVIGDGGFVFAMEKRGYVKAGPWTPEVVMEHPEAGIFFYTKTRVKSHYFSCLLKKLHLTLNLAPEIFQEYIFF